MKPGAGDNKPASQVRRSSNLRGGTNRKDSQLRDLRWKFGNKWTLRRTAQVSNQHLINKPVLPGLGSETWDFYSYLSSPWAPNRRKIIASREGRRECPSSRLFYLH